MTEASSHPSHVLVDGAPINTDIAIQRVGGNHLFQLIAGVSLILTFTLSGQIIYGLSYLQNIDDLDIECRSDPNQQYITCTKEEACSAGDYRFNTETGLENWITLIPEMLCYSSTKLTLTGLCTSLVSSLAPSSGCALLTLWAASGWSWGVSSSISSPS